MSKIKIGNVKGQDGFSPTVKENLNNTNDDYRLDITDKNGTFTTPNLKEDSKYIAETYATKVQVDELKSDLAGLFALDVTWNEDYYIRPGNGAMISYPENESSKLWASDPIPVIGGMKLVTQYYGYGAIIGYAFYDKKGNHIEGYGGNDGVGEIRNILVPNNAVSFRYTKDTKKGHNYDYNLYYSINSETDIKLIESIDKVVEMRNDVLPDGLNDFNNFPSGTIYKILGSKTESEFANAPIYPYKGLIITLNSTRDVENVKLQIATTNENRIFMRSMWTSWGDWVEVKQNNATTTTQSGNILAMYDNITCIGDSLTWGQVYTRRNPNDSRQAYRPYPQVLAKQCGAEYEILANPGDSASQAWERWNHKLIAKDNNINIVYLGTNGGLTDTIETDCPSDGEYSDTNTGCYGKILKKIYDLGQKAILVKIYDSSGDISTTNIVIEKFATKFNIPFVEAIELGDVYRMCPLDHSNNGGVHYNDLGYSVFANRLIDEVNSLSESMLERLVSSN